MNCFVKESHGVIWHFYHNSHGICYCQMNDENIREYQVLLPDGQEDFDVIVDDSDCVHMVFQNSQGDIMYANHFNGKWRKTTLMKSKGQGCYPKSFAIKRVGNFLNLLYCIQYNGRMMLTHQIIDGGETNPYVLDCIKGEYTSAQDSSGNIYVLFYSETNQAWGIKEYVWSKKEWAEFTPYERLVEVKNPFLYIDSDDKIHIVYEKNMFVTEFFEGEEITAGTGQKPIMLHNREDMVMWEGITDNKVYIKKPKDSAPTVILSGGFSKPTRYKIRFTSYEYDLKAECCLGNITNGAVRLYGINNFFAVSNVSPAGDTVDMEIKKLKIKISQLNGIIESLQSKIQEYDAKKIDHRLNEIETAVSKNNRHKFLSFF